MADDVTARISSPHALRCADLSNCGWGMRPSIRQFAEMRDKQKTCARCGGPMEVVTADEFHGRLPTRIRNDDPS
jgi:hypothetical protein